MNTKCLYGAIMQVAGTSSRLLKRVLPSSLVKRIQAMRIHIRCLPFFLRDMARFARASAYASPNSEPYIRSHLIMACHQIEKGLGMPSPRRNFGKDVVKRLINLKKVYSCIDGAHKEILVHANDALHAYSRFHDNASELQKLIDSNLDSDMGDTRLVGVIPNSSLRSPITAEQYDGFFNSRFSVRNFSSRALSPEILSECVSVAIKTPSVCNRQDWRCLITTGIDECAAALRFQNGSRGFSHNVPGLLVVLGDLSLMMTPMERNQPYIDGGMYAMSIVLALHSRGLGAVCLNLCNTPEVDRGLREHFRIRDCEVPIMMIAVGYTADDALVGLSTRILGKEN